METHHYAFDTEAEMRRVMRELGRVIKSMKARREVTWTVNACNRGDDHTVWCVGTQHISCVGRLSNKDTLARELYTECYALSCCLEALEKRQA